MANSKTSVGKPEYLYRVDRDWKTGVPKLYRLRIIKRAKKRIRTVRAGLAFGCRAQFEPGEQAETPAAAWGQFITHILAEHDEALETAKRALAAYKAACKLQGTTKAIEED